MLSGKAESPATDEELRLEVSRTLTTLLTDRLGGNFPWPGISWCSDTDRVLCRADEFAALFFDSKPQSKAGPGHRPGKEAVMRAINRIVLIAGLVAGSGARVYAQGDVGSQKDQLEHARRQIASMREIHAIVLRKEKQAKAENDAVRLNCVHQTAARIADLVDVADHAFEDMRIAVTARESAEAVDGELEKIGLVRSKVEQQKAEAERCVGLKMVGTDNGEGLLERQITGGPTDADPDPLSTLLTPPPFTSSRPPPASPISGY